MIRKYLGKERTRRRKKGGGEALGEGISMIDDELKGLPKHGKYNDEARQDPNAREP